MKDVFVSLETAILAKSKGFNWETNRYFDSDRYDFSDDSENWNQYEDYYSCPTQSLLAKWLRDVHGIHLVIIPVVTMGYTFKLLKVWKKDFNPELEIETPPYKEVNAYDYNDYEEALEEGLKEALKLVEYPKPDKS